jgi:hypothetical protein
MKKLIGLLTIALLFSLTLHAQVKFGIKAGVSTPSGSLGSFQVNHLDTSFAVALKDANVGFHAGIWARFGKHIFVQPEVYLNSNSNDYKLTGSIYQDLIKKEQFQYVDLPVLFGVKIGIMSLSAGPVGHYFLKSTSELIDVAGYEDKFDDFTFSYQAGIGLEANRFALDLRYQGRMKNDAGHMSFFGQNYEFDKTPASFKVSVRYSLF